MDRALFLGGLVFALVACDRQADVGDLPAGEQCATTRECASGLSCIRNVCTKDDDQLVITPSQKDASVEFKDGSTPGEVSLENLSARLTRRYSCSAGVGRSFIECGDYEVSFSLANRSDATVDRLTHVVLDIGGVRIVQNVTCRDFPWRLPPHGSSGLAVFHFVYRDSSDQTIVELPCNGMTVQEPWSHLGLPPVIRSGNVELSLSVLLGDARLMDATATVPLRDDT